MSRISAPEFAISMNGNRWVLGTGSQIELEFYRNRNHVLMTEFRILQNRLELLVIHTANAESPSA